MQHRLLLVSIAAAYLLAGCLDALGWNWTDNKMVNQKNKPELYLLLVWVKIQWTQDLSLGDGNRWSSFGRTGCIRWPTRSLRGLFYNSVIMTSFALLFGLEDPLDILPSLYVEGFRHWNSPPFPVVSIHTGRHHNCPVQVASFRRCMR